jgi:Domain of unknown function (DUF1877)
MGVYCILYQVTASEVKRILWSNPTVAEALLESLSDKPSKVSASEKQLSLFDWTAYPSPTILNASLDKSWGALHFLLNDDPQGGRPPLSLAIFGGESADLPDHDSLKVLGTKEVAEIADALQGLSVEELRQKFDVAKFAANKIYPGIWDGGRDKLLTWLMGYFDQLVSIYQDAKDCNNSILIWFC